MRQKGISINAAFSIFLEDFLMVPFGMQCFQWWPYGHSFPGYSEVDVIRIIVIYGVWVDSMLKYNYFEMTEINIISYWNRCDLSWKRWQRWHQYHRRCRRWQVRRSALLYLHVHRFHMRVVPSHKVILYSRWSVKQVCRRSHKSNLNDTLCLTLRSLFDRYFIFFRQAFHSSLHEGGCLLLKSCGVEFAERSNIARGQTYFYNWLHF